MKIKLLLATMMFSAMAATAQTDDPVVMTINGHPVPRSEFEYSYNKNNSEGVIDKKSVKDYVPLFINYKLKVQAALDAHLDTLKSYQNEFAGYRDMQIRPALIDSTDIENAARVIYKQTQEEIDNNGGLARASHILVLVNQRATPEQQKAAKERIDSIYNALKHGADFAELAKKCSGDTYSARNGGDLGWFQKGRMIKVFENSVWALKDGQMSKPFLSPYGWHIVLKTGARKFFDYASQRQDILNFIDQQGLREQIISQKLDTLAKQQGTTPEKILDAKLVEMEAQDPNLKYLVQEYHDGLLLYEICNRLVWKRAQDDVAGQNRYFKKHRKQYRWEQPRFKGISYVTRDSADIQRVKDAVAGLPFDQWADKLRSTFNNDSVLRIRVEKGVFKRGDDALVDKEAFGVDTVPRQVKGYPYAATYGKVLNAPEDIDDVKQLVIADYQDELEKAWVKRLRKQYAVKVDEKVLETVNNH